MNAAFADTFYFLALLNRRDAKHERAIAASQVRGRSLLTTEFVLLELADALSQPPLREEFDAILGLVQNTPTFRVVPATTDLLHRGIRLYNARADKAWQLTDCISFVVMEQEGLRDALTGDRHFEQAGFNVLLA